MKELNNKQKIFCREYVKNGNNATQAYMKAYPDSSEKSAKDNASRLIAKDSIQNYIQELQGKMEDKEIMSAKERMKWLTNLIDGKETTSDKLKAIEILNKMSGEYVTKVEADVSASIEIDIEDE